MPTAGIQQNRMRKHSKLLLALIWSGIAFLLDGCGGGISSFTGGGIPPGRSAVLGQVIQAANPAAPVPGATVTITTSTPNGQFLSYRVYTDSSGQFSINGIPTGSVESPVTIQVQPNDMSLQSQHVSFLLANNRPTQVVIALLPANFNAANVAKITITQVSNPSGNAPLYKAQVYDAQGNLLAIFPTLIVDGGVAAVNTNGTFTVAGAAANITPQSITATVPSDNIPNPPTTTLPLSNGGKPTPDPNPIPATSSGP